MILVTLCSRVIVIEVLVNLFECLHPDFPLPGNHSFLQCLIGFVVIFFRIVWLFWRGLFNDWRKLGLALFIFCVAVVHVGICLVAHHVFYLADGDVIEVLHHCLVLVLELNLDGSDWDFGSVRLWLWLFNLQMVQIIWIFVILLANHLVARIL